MSDILRKGHETWERKVRRGVWALMGDYTATDQVPLNLLRAEIFEENISSTFCCLYLPILCLKEIFKLREVWSYVGKIEQGKGKTRGWTSGQFRIQPGKQQPGDVCSHPTVSGDWNTASFSRHCLYICSLNPSALYGEALWLYHPCSLFSHSFLMAPVLIFHNMNYIL